ncbi:hypothetical protein EsH8_XV_000025 [Colletotrichum jinshuiense]
MDGKPLFPNNQHPYNEADDVQEPRLDNESILLALTRHTLELSVALDELLAQLDRQGLGNALYLLTPWWLSGLFRIASPLGPQQPSSGDSWEAGFEDAIRDGAALPVKIRDALIIPRACNLGHVSAGTAHLHAFSLASSKPTLTSCTALAARHPLRVTVAAGTDAMFPTITIDAVYVRYIADTGGDVSALEEASLVAASWIAPAHPTGRSLAEGLPFLMPGEQVAPVPDVKLKEDLFALEYRCQLGILEDGLGFESKTTRGQE